MAGEEATVSVALKDQFTNKHTALEHGDQVRLGDPLAESLNMTLTPTDGGRGIMHTVPAEGVRQDNGDGTFKLKYTLNEAQQWTLSVLYKGQPIVSKFITITSAATSATMSVISAPAVTGVAGAVNTFTIEARDEFDNVRVLEKDTELAPDVFVVDVKPTPTGAVTVTPPATLGVPGVYVASWTSSDVGGEKGTGTLDYAVSVSNQGETLRVFDSAKTPSTLRASAGQWTVTLSSADASAEVSEIAPAKKCAAGSDCAAGTKVGFEIMSLDRFGNARPSSMGVDYTTGSVLVKNTPCYVRLYDGSSFDGAWSAALPGAGVPGVTRDNIPCTR